MGIPAFYGVFLKNLNRNSERKFIITREDVREKIIVMNIDMNSVLHQAAQIAFGYGSDQVIPITTWSSKSIRDRFSEEIQNQIRSLYDAYQPQIMHIAVDGTPPIAKLKQQRERRYRGLYELEVVQLDSYASQGLRGFLLTPGSFLMEWITLNLPDIISALQLKNVEIIIDGSNIPGEGEQKFMNSLFGRDLMDLSYDRGGTVLTVGADADLILMMLASRGSGYIDRAIEDLDVIDIGQLAEVIGEKYPLFDFIFMSMLLGNDFVPPLPILEDVRDNFQRILDTYENIRRDRPDFRLIQVEEYNDYEYDPDGTRGIVNRCNLDNLRILFREISTFEHREMQRLSRSILRSDPLLARSFRSGITNITDRWYGRIVGKSSASRRDIEDVNEQYVTGLMWAFRYLTAGSEIHTDSGSYPILNMSYIYPYDFAPMASGLVDVQIVNSTLFVGDQVSESRGVQVTNPFTSSILSFPYVLGARRVISPIFSWIYQLPSVREYWNDLFPSSMINDTMTVFRDYTSRITLPEISPTFIERFQREFDETLRSHPESFKYFNRVYNNNIILI